VRLNPPSQSEQRDQTRPSTPFLIGDARRSSRMIALIAMQSSARVGACAASDPWPASRSDSSTTA
jgi:hypothetical protein